MIATSDCVAVFRHPGKAKAADQIALDMLRERGLRVAEIPAGIACGLDGEGAITTISYDPHIDRMAAMVKGHDGASTLLIPATFQTGALTSPDSPETSIDAVRKACDAADIDVRVSPPTSVPMGTSLVQSADGTIVTGCCDPAWIETLSEIAGDENVYATHESLTAYPTFGSAGIHCLITESPEFLLPSCRAGATIPR